MKIALPVDEKSIEGKLCISFGRTPYFLIYDTESDNTEFLDNSAVASQGGAGIKAAQSIVDNQVEALITPRCGQNAADVLNQANIKIYKSINESIKETIDMFKKDKLEILTDIHAGFHNHGGNKR
jgi:predicted Fe-Mo cluster-binding NifX family protein